MTTLPWLTPCSISQVNVSGSGNSLPSSQETVEIPGLYNNVQFPDIWTFTGSSFPAPGPPVAALAGGNGSTSSSDQSNSPSSAVQVSFVSGTQSLTAASTPLPTASGSNSVSAASPTSSAQCRVVARSSGGLSRRRHALMRRHST